MKRLADANIADTYKTTLKELSRRLQESFDIEDMILFGSVARSDNTTESDIDVLILTSTKYTRAKRHQITDIVFDINLKYSANISTVVIDKPSWDTGPQSVMPLKTEVLNEGIQL